MTTLLSLGSLWVFIPSFYIKTLSKSLFFFLLPLFAVSQYALSTASIRRVLISYSNAFFQSQLGVSFISQITPAVGDTLDRW